MSSCNVQLELDLGIKDYNKIIDENRSIASDGTSYVNARTALQLAKQADNAEEARAVLVDRLNKGEYYNKVKSLLTEEVEIRYEYNGKLQPPIKATLDNVTIVRDDEGAKVAKVRLRDENGKYSTYFYGTGSNQSEYSQENNGRKVRISNAYNVFHKAKTYADNVLSRYDYASNMAAEDIQEAKRLVDLGSKTTETVIDLNNYAKQEDYQHGNIEYMKGLLDKVNTLGVRKHQRNTSMQLKSCMIRSIHISSIRWS